MRSERFATPGRPTGPNATHPAHVPHRPGGPMGVRHPFSVGPSALMLYWYLRSRQAHGEAAVPAGAP